MLKDYLTVEEAKINNNKTQQIDFENPTKDIVGGLPGFVRPIDRVRQLEMIKKNHALNIVYGDQLMKENRPEQNRKVFQPNRSKKPLMYDTNELNNDYQYMKDKFENRPFNIISNK